MVFANTYQDPRRAAAYATLEFPGTYYLAFRDLPEVFQRHVNGRRAVDFGCGAGRSTRFLRRQGFDAAGVDIAEEMIRQAMTIDPRGDYRVIADADLGGFDRASYDLVFSGFTFDNIPTTERKTRILRNLRGLLRGDGRIVNLVSSPEIYLHEWASFSTKDYPENRLASSGDVVRIVNTEIDDRRPVEDILCPDETYRAIYREAGLEVVETHRPLGREGEPFCWVSETRIAPWVIYVLRRTSGEPD